MPVEGERPFSIACPLWCGYRALFLIIVRSAVMIALLRVGWRRLGFFMIGHCAEF